MPSMPSPSPTNSRWASRLKDKGFSIRDYLNAKAKAVLDDIDPSLTSPRGGGESPVNKKRTKKDTTLPPGGVRRGSGSTQATTYKMFREGKSIEAIAKERSLTTGTIENHLAHYVEKGDLKVSEVVSTQHQKIIRGIVRSFDKAYSLSDVKNLLPNDYSYAEIKLVIADMNKENE